MAFVSDATNLVAGDTNGTYDIFVKDLQDGSLVVNTGFALTATVDILKDIAAGTGPRRCILALGYAGWGPGQLDSEIKANGWLNVAADDDLVFDATLDTKWERAMAKIGIDPRMLSDSAGHA